MVFDKLRGQLEGGGWASICIPSARQNSNTYLQNRELDGTFLQLVRFEINCAKNLEIGNRAGQLFKTLLFPSFFGGFQKFSTGIFNFYCFSPITRRYFDHCLVEENQ